MTSMATKRIIIDMDEVICDFSTPLIDIYNNRHGDNMVLEDITEWQLKPELMEIFQNVEGFFVGLAPLDGAISGIEELAKYYDIVIASSPSYNGRIASEKMTWIKIWLPKYMDRLVLTQNKGLLGGYAIIDDSIRFLEQFGGKKIVMDRPWNRGYRADKRVDDWDDILNYFIPFRTHDWG